MGYKMKFFGKYILLILYISLNDYNFLFILSPLFNIFLFTIIFYKIDFFQKNILGYISFFLYLILCRKLKIL